MVTVSFFLFCYDMSMQNSEYPVRNESLESFVTVKAKLGLSVFTWFYYDLHSLNFSGLILTIK
jgi:hypothetical protein